jgi:hypothetical protein
MVRNEVDVMEAFVRHNLSFLDGIFIVDHGSFDGTSDVLASLRAEGLPLQVTQEADPAYRQSETMTELARDGLREGADFVFAIDADEFLKVDSRASLERALADVPSGMHAAMHWLTYVPDAFDDEEFGQGHLWWRLKAERHGLSKVIAGRALLDRPGDAIAMGNHAVLSAGAAVARPHARLSRETVALAHCPVRSRVQLEAKIIVGHLANLASRPAERRLARHWRELYEELRAGKSPDEQRLRDIASNYGLPIRNWRPAAEIELTEDPVGLVAACRYRSDAVRDPLRLLMRFTEGLVDQERARLAGGRETPGAKPTEYVTL